MNNSLVFWVIHCFIWIFHFLIWIIHRFIFDTTTNNSFAVRQQYGNGFFLNYSIVYLNNPLFYLNISLSYSNNSRFHFWHSNKQLICPLWLNLVDWLLENNSGGFFLNNSQVFVFLNNSLLYLDISLSYSKNSPFHLLICWETTIREQPIHTKLSRLTDCLRITLKVCKTMSWETSGQRVLCYVVCSCF